MPPLQNAVLYGILDLGYTAPALAVARTRDLLAGGVDVLQLRAKGHDLAVIRDLGSQLLMICREARVPFILNDYPELAAELDTDGVHIGQDDGPLQDARCLIGPGKIVGRSTHTPEQARAALAEGFDYIGFGPLFPTPTKMGRPGIGIQDIAMIEREVGGEIPVFCIGGIKRSNLAAVMAAGAKRVVIVSDLLTAPDVALATREACGFLRSDS